jgi:hypothetical protein
MVGFEEVGRKEGKKREGYVPFRIRLNDCPDRFVIPVFTDNLSISEVGSPTFIEPVEHCLVYSLKFGPPSVILNIF